MNKEKVFNISKKVVGEAYQRVRANKGAAGVDVESNRFRILRGI